MTHAHQFDDPLQQHEAATLGMWTFLATEVLFFGGLLMAYAIYRHAYPAAWQEGSRHLKEYLGAINTGVLLTSSLTMALAVHFAHHHKKRPVQLALAATLLLGLSFLAIKATEYTLEFDEHLIPAVNFHFDGTDPQHVELFMVFYFLTTLLHATHMLVGLGLLTFLLIGTSKNHFLTPNDHPNTLEIIGLYWHFVDLVWIFLFPLLYLVK
jgi:cytochrome c oxidase subunit 3